MSQWVLCFWQLMGNTFRWHHSLGGGWTLIAAHKLTKAFPVSGVGFRQTPSRRGWTGWRSSTRLFWTFTRGIEPKQRVSRQTRPAVGTWGRVYCNTSLRHLLGCASGFTLHLRVFASLICVSLIYLWEIFFFSLYVFLFNLNPNTFVWFPSHSCLSIYIFYIYISMFLWQSAASASAGNNKGHFQYLRWLLPYTLIYVSAIICIYLDSDCIFCII